MTRAGMSGLAALMAPLALLAWVAGCGEDNKTGPDTTAPQVSITSPGAGAVVRDSVVIQAAASDNRGVVAVDFYVDGDSLGSDAAAPFQQVWRLAGEVLGPHTLKCRARDGAGNQSWSEEIAVTIGDVVFTANFTNDWLLASQGAGLLWLSTPAGALLADTTWSGNRSLDVLRGSGVTEFPGDIAVTVATSDESGTRVSLTTNRGAQPDTWTWRGRQRPEFGESPAQITLTMSGAPNHIGYVVSSPWADEASLETALPAQLGFPLHDQSNELLVIFGTRSGAARFRAYPGVTPGGSGQLTVDLATTTAATQRTVTLPATGEAFAATLHGFATAGVRDAGLYLLSTAASATHAENAVLYHPGNRFSDYLTHVRVDEDVTGRTYWSETRIGALPTTFTDLDADLGFSNPLPTAFAIVVAGSADQIRSCWAATVGGVEYRWFVYSPRADRSYALPALPARFAARFGAVSPADFELLYAEVLEYPQADSHTQILDRTFSGTLFVDQVQICQAKGLWSVDPDFTLWASHHNNSRDAFSSGR